MTINTTVRSPVNKLPVDRFTAVLHRCQILICTTGSTAQYRISHPLSLFRSNLLSNYNLLRDHEAFLSPHPRAATTHHPERCLLVVVITFREHEDDWTAGFCCIQSRRRRRRQ
jgi:hypothetical protein